ncbi:hypothetical protein ACLOJK_027019 [Asimina triloba]
MAARQADSAKLVSSGRCQQGRQIENGRMGGGELADGRDEKWKIEKGRMEGEEQAERGRSEEARRAELPARQIRSLPATKMMARLRRRRWRRPSALLR